MNSRIRSRLALALASFLLIQGLAWAVPESRQAVVEAISKARPSVVTVKTPRPDGSDGLSRAGVVVDDSGVIITTNHLIGTCKTPKVVLEDGTALDAEILFAEGRWDLAALRIKVDPKAKAKLKALALAEKDDLVVGETVIAIGHPFGHSYSASTGIVGALGREITLNGFVLTGLIQTDAAVNPGNSGGPLLDINGRLIGIICAMDSRGRGIAFAIPISTIKKAMSLCMPKN